MIVGLQSSAMRKSEFSYNTDNYASFDGNSPFFPSRRYVVRQTVDGTSLPYWGPGRSGLY